MNLIFKPLIFCLFYKWKAHSASLNCAFDGDFCDWSQDDSDEFNWTRTNWGTGTQDTGPTYDHTSGDWKGYYIYTESSRPRLNGDKAKLISPVQEPGTYCLIFWYSMYGADIGILNVYTKPNYTIIFTRSGNIGDNNWRSEAISYNATAKFKIVIEGIRGQDTKGDIAVDDISMTPGLCKPDCTFDDGLCDWKQDTTDDFDWTRIKGETPTNSSRPPADHTTGERLIDFVSGKDIYNRVSVVGEKQLYHVRLEIFFTDGFYIYIETNGYVRNKRARVISPCQRSGKYCFSFWYYMYGHHVDTLRVLIKDEQGNVTKVLNISGQQGQAWIQENLKIQSALRFSIIIEGKVIDSYNHSDGNIAIDDTLMFPCQDCTDPVPIHGATNTTNFQHGSAIEVICDYGYYLIGPSSIVCQTGGTWSAYPTCDPVDCGSRKIVNGEFSAVSGTTYDKTATQSCDIGYVFTGDALVECIVSGWNGSAATCTIVDCFTPTVYNGTISETAKHTTYNQTVRIICGNGFKLLGNAFVTCQADGNWTSLPSCVIEESEKNSTMIAVYVLLPVAVVALVIAPFVLIWRKHVIGCLPVSDANRERDMKKQPNERTRPVPLFSNITYSDHHDKMQSNPGNALSQDTEFAIITEDRNGKLHYYDHIKTSATPVFDKAYSHFSGYGGSNESNYDTTSLHYPGHVSLRTNTTTENNCYDVLNYKDSKHCSGTKNHSNMQDNPYSEYDHAKAGGIDPVDLDDYSHLNDKRQ